MVHAVPQSRAEVVSSISHSIGGGNSLVSVPNVKSKPTEYEKVEVWTQTDRVYSLNMKRCSLKIETFLQRWRQTDDLEMDLRAHNADDTKSIAHLEILESVAHFAHC